MIVVFGGSGFIGSRAVELLRSSGETVEVVTHNTSRASRPGYRFGNILRAETLEAAVRGADVVIQSTTFPGYPREKPRRGMTFDAYDGAGTERVVAAAARAGVKRFVYVSGVGVRPDSERPYYRAIHRAERAVLSAPFSAACLRPAFVYGPNDRGLNLLLAWGRRTRVLPIPGLGSQHQPVHIDDVAGMLVELAKPDAPAGVFELGGPERMSMKDMLTRAFSTAGVRCGFIPVPKPLARLGGRVFARLPGELLTPAAIDFICEDFLADNRRSLEILKKPLRNFDDGIREYCQ